MRYRLLLAWAALLAGVAGVLAAAAAFVTAIAA